MIKPSIFPENIVVAQSTRAGGCSIGPFASLNLGLSVHDDRNSVLNNMEIFCSSLHISKDQISKSHQVHGAEILVSTRPGNYSGYDAQITNVKNNYLAITIADCVPVLIYDEKNIVVAAIHAGWKGTLGGITSRTMLAMNKTFETDGHSCKAWIGASISVNCYEVGEEIANQFDDSCKVYKNKTKTWFLDLKEANKQQLIAAGLKPENIEISEHCTVSNKELFFSHRRDNGITGRMMALIGIS